jgi:hypothetical protein
VIENSLDAAIVVDGSTTVGTAAGGAYPLLLSPTDGTLISSLQVVKTYPWAAAVDAHGNTLMTGTYWPGAVVGGQSLPNPTGFDQPLLVVAFNGASQIVGVATLGATNSAQPLAMAVDPTSGYVFVPFTLPTGFTSSVGPIAAGSAIAIFGPDPCDDGAGPSGPATGSALNHGDLAADGGSPYVPPNITPAACPANVSGAVNGAACPVAMGCLYGAGIPNTIPACCYCAPRACNGAATIWACYDLEANNKACPASAPAPGTACPSNSLQCDYCMPEGLVVAVCTAAGEWVTGDQQSICQ